MERRFDMYSPEPRHDMLRTILSRDMRRIERIRRMASAKEREIFGSILAEGVKAGDFDPEQARRIPALEVLFVGSDYLSIRSGTDDDRTSLMRRRHDIIDFIIQGLASRPVGQADAVP